VNLIEMGRAGATFELRLPIASAVPGVVIDLIDGSGSDLVSNQLTETERR
jgi:hypothetical protein